MSRRFKIFAAILLLLCAALSGLATYLVGKSHEKKSSDATQNDKQPALTLVTHDGTEMFQPLPTSVATNVLGVSTSAIKVGGWIPGFDFQAGYESVKSNKSSFFAVHYAGGSVQENGEISFSADLDARVAMLNNLSLPIGLNVISSNAAGTENFLKSTDLQTKFQQRLGDLKSKYQNFSAINIDFEKIQLSDKDAFKTFLQNLKGFAKTRGMELNVTVYPNFQGDTNITEAKQVHDYSFLGTVSDKVIIMAYDYPIVQRGIQGSYTSNAPVEWVEKIVLYASAKVPREKLVIGLPLYGYGYKKGTTSPKITTSYTYAQIQSIILNEKLTAQYDADLHEMFIDRANERIYFQNNETLAERKNIILNAGINKVFYWRLGRDNGIGN